MNPGNGCKSRFYMDSDAKESKEALYWEITTQAKKNNCPKFKDTIVILETQFINFRSNRDTDNCYKAVKDSFQSTGIVDNDKNIIERTMQRMSTDEKENYILASIYEAKGNPELKDFYRYFYWCDTEIKF
jgi:Holliday junction resolvase RusA-like endonuclease